MNDEQESDVQIDEIIVIEETPNIFAETTLPDKAVQFLHDVTLEIEKVIAEVEQGVLTPKEAHKFYRQALGDIRREIKEFPTAPITARETCRNCLVNYNNCYSPPSVCIANYRTCAGRCTQ